MAPTSRRGKTTGKASKPRRSHYKRKMVKPAIQKATVLEELPSNSSIITSDNLSKTEGFDSSTTTASPCSTPKAQRFRIPEMDTCPPAPKKQRVLSNCSLQRTPVAFFSPPDLDLFFFFALRDISV